MFQIVRGRFTAPALVVALATMAIVAAPSDAVDSPPARSVLNPTAVIDASSPAPTKSGLASALDPVVPSGTKFAIADPSAENVVFGRQANSVAIPASTMKLITAASVLTALGPNARITTKVVRAGDTIWLVGGGDPTLVSSRSDRTPGPQAGGPAALTDLAAPVIAALGENASVKLKYDASLFTGPTTGPGWSSSFPSAGVAAPVSALVVDGARAKSGSISRVSDPAKQAAFAFAELLRGQGVRVGAVRRGQAPGDAQLLASVESMTIADMVERAETDSDNDVAEALAHLAGAKRSNDASFTGGAAASITALKELGIPTDGLVIADGSGLSPQNRVAPSTLTAVLTKAVRLSPAELWPITSGLAVAGFTGTMADRMNTKAAGVVRAKTGTLIGVNSLAGTVRDNDGRVLVFAYLYSGSANVEATRAALDTSASVLAYCGCR